MRGLLRRSGEFLGNCARLHFCSGQGRYPYDIKCRFVVGGGKRHHQHSTYWACSEDCRRRATRTRAGLTRLIHGRPQHLLGVRLAPRPIICKLLCMHVSYRSSTLAQTVQIRATRPDFLIQRMLIGRTAHQTVMDLPQFQNAFHSGKEARGNIKSSLPASEFIRVVCLLGLIPFFYQDSRHHQPT